MSIVAISERIHHGDYFNRRVAVLSALEEGELKGFLDQSPYATTGFTSDRVVFILNDLIESGNAEFGWATYTITKLDDEPECGFHAYTPRREAVGVAPADDGKEAIPMCAGCAEIYCAPRIPDRKFVYFPRSVTPAGDGVSAKLTPVVNNEAVAAPGVQTSPDTYPEGSPSWGDLNRQLLAERLRKAYYMKRAQEWYYDRYVKTQPIDDEWLAVADEAIVAWEETFK